MTNNTPQQQDTVNPKLTPVMKEKLTHEPKC